MVVNVKNLSEMDDFAVQFLKTLSPLNNRATILSLSGELGSGKTAFVKSLGRALSIKETINSPTFVLLKNYELKGSLWRKLVHIDAYRIENENELKPLKFNELINDPNLLVAIEWPEKIKLQKEIISKSLEFSFVDENTRKVTIK